MCGFIGSTEYKINRRTLNDLYQRGPDSRGLFDDNRVSLGHTRLAIRDLESGQQPMEFNGLHLVYNGEIYNCIELKAKLGWPKLKTTSDTEILLKCLDVFGIEQTLKEINGMFAFALYDTKENKIYLARDRMGIKPLFMAISTCGEVSFSSDLNALVRLIGAENLSIDHRALSMFFNCYYVASPYTIWREVSSIEPGTYIEFDLNSTRHKIKQYWNLKDQFNFSALGNLRNLEDIIEDSIQRRIVSDVGYSAYLSGGVDSSLLVTLLNKQMGNNFTTFTAEIDDERYNEKRFADAVCKRFNLKNESCFVSYDDIEISFLRNLVKCFGQPFADSSIIPTYMISKKISEKHTVVLGGDGPDEVFCGYDKYALIGQRTLQEMFFRNLNLDFLKREYRDDTLKNMNPKFTSQERNLRYLDMRFFLEGDILQKVDRLSMANSLEVRVPFLDHRVVEGAGRMHFEYIFHLERKYLLKQLLRQYFRNDFVSRPKVGFQIDLGWLKKYKFKNNLNRTGVFNNIKPNRIKDNYLKFALLMFDLWYQEYYE